MQRNINQLAQDHYDVLVIGGGINGAAIAHLAAARGLKAALLEKNDFGSGASSKSTKLIHGGIRYLEQLHFGLVREALEERAVQLKAAPHLVRPLSFIVPVYSGDRRPLWMMRMGVFLYDLMAGKKTLGKHKHLKVQDIVKLVPGIRRDGLKGGVLYWDAQMDDARLCLENVLSAADRGAQVANYAEVTCFVKIHGEVAGVDAWDHVQDRPFRVRARKVICTVGPWANRVLRMDQPNARKRLRTTKGVHVVYRGQVSNHAFLLPVKQDGRIFFIVPWMGNSLIGTTDTDYIGNPDLVAAEDKDIDYLLEGARRAFPDRDFTKEGIIATFSGLRPLVRRGGSPSGVSRKHVIEEMESGLIFVMGGKYTTYRKIAEDCLALIAPKHGRGQFQLYGGRPVAETREAVASEYDVPVEAAEAIMAKYGARYRDVLNLTRDDPKLKEPLCSCGPFLKAQLRYATEVEMAQTADDIVSRRLSLHYIPCRTGRCRDVIRQFFAIR